MVDGGQRPAQLAVDLTVIGRRQHTESFYRPNANHFIGVRAQCLLNNRQNLLRRSQCVVRVNAIHQRLLNRCSEQSCSQAYLLLPVQAKCSSDLLHLINVQDGEALGYLERALQAAHLLWMHVRAVIKVAQAIAVLCQGLLQHARKQVPPAVGSIKGRHVAPPFLLKYSLRLARLKTHRGVSTELLLMLRPILTSIATLRLGPAIVTTLRSCRRPVIGSVALARRWIRGVLLLLVWLLLTGTLQAAANCPADCSTHGGPDDNRDDDQRDYYTNEDETAQ